MGISGLHPNRAKEDVSIRFSFPGLPLLASLQCFHLTIFAAVKEVGELRVDLITP